MFPHLLVLVFLTTATFFSENDKKMFFFVKKRFFLLSPFCKFFSTEPKGKSTGGVELLELLFSFPSPPRRLHDFGGVGCGTWQCLMAARPTLRGTGGGLLLL